MLSAPSKENIVAIINHLQDQGGAFVIMFDPERADWTCSMEWGREADDSPMAAAAAYSVDITPEDAIQKLVDEAKINVSTL